jgi:hypothetical protein
VADAKRRGWSGRSTTSASLSGRSKSTRGRKKKKKKDFDAASSAGWTDVTTASYASEPQRNEKKGKCAIM